MKKYIVLILSILWFCSPVFAFQGGGGGLAGQVVGGSSAVGPKDYTQDASCKGAWFMNSAGDAEEIDRSTAGTETLEERSETTVDSSADHPPGYSGKSKDFEIDDNEQLGAADGGTTDIFGANISLSICLWIKFEADPGMDVYLVNKWDTTMGNHQQYQFKHDHATNALEILLSSNGSDVIKAIGATDLADDTNWHHVCAVYDDTDLRIYVDGSLDSSGDNPIAWENGIFGSDALFVVANDWNGNDGFDGLMDELIILNRDLSAAEVTEIYTYGIDGSNGGND